MKLGIWALVGCFGSLSLTSSSALAWVISDHYESDNPSAVCRLTITNALPDSDGVHSRHQCGGTLIGPNLIITAAHCIESVQSTIFHEIQVQCPKETERFFGVMIANPLDWNGSDGSTDISFIRLNRDATNTVPMKIATTEAETKKAIQGNCYLAGYGPSKTEPAGSLNTALIKGLQFNLINVDTPEGKLYSRKSIHTENPFTWIDQGDSGGALYCKKTDDEEILVGIISQTIQLENRSIKKITQKSIKKAVFSPAMYVTQALDHLEITFDPSFEQLKLDAFLWLNRWKFSTHTSALRAILRAKENSSSIVEIPISNKKNYRFEIHPFFLSLKLPNMDVLNLLSIESADQLWESAQSAFQLIKLGELIENDLTKSLSPSAPTAR